MFDSAREYVVRIRGDASDVTNQFRYAATGARLLNTALASTATAVMKIGAVMTSRAFGIVTLITSFNQLRSSAVAAFNAVEDAAVGATYRVHASLARMQQDIDAALEAPAGVTASQMMAIQGATIGQQKQMTPGGRRAWEQATARYTELFGGDPAKNAALVWQQAHAAGMHPGQWINRYDDAPMTADRRGRRARAARDQAFTAWGRTWSTLGRRFFTDDIGGLVATGREGLWGALEGEANLWTGWIEGASRQLDRAGDFAASLDPFTGAWGFGDREEYWARVDERKRRERAMRRGANLDQIAADYRFGFRQSTLAFPHWQDQQEREAEYLRQLRTGKNPRSAEARARMLGGYGGGETGFARALTQGDSEVNQWLMELGYSTEALRRLTPDMVNMHMKAKEFSMKAVAAADSMAGLANAAKLQAFQQLGVGVKTAKETYGPYWQDVLRVFQSREGGLSTRTGFANVLDATHGKGTADLLKPLWEGLFDTGNGGTSNIAAPVVMPSIYSLSKSGPVSQGVEIERVNELVGQPNLGLP